MAAVPSDARVPCPLCGGLVHPVAGRCKHCKEDLTTYRAGRPQAAAALPALQRGNGNGNGNGFVASAIPAPAAPAALGYDRPPYDRTPVPIAVPAHEGSQPILPPRPTGRSVAAQDPRSMWKSWPMLVIALAMLAIVVAIVIMVWPATKDNEAKRALQPPPAPERMETNPLPPAGAGNSNGADPWGGHSQADPAPTRRQTPDPLPPNAPDPDNLVDPFGGGAGGGGGNDILFTAMDHACKKLKSCPDADLSMMTTMCDSVRMFAQPSAPVTCDAAKQCFDAIDKLDCSQTGTTTSPLSMVNTIQDCAKAATSC